MNSGKNRYKWCYIVWFIILFDIIYMVTRKQLNNGDCLTLHFVRCPFSRIWTCNFWLTIKIIIKSLKIEKWFLFLVTKFNIKRGIIESLHYVCPLKHRPNISCQRYKISARHVILGVKIPLIIRSHPIRSHCSLWSIRDSWMEYIRGHDAACEGGGGGGGGPCCAVCL